MRCVQKLELIFNVTQSMRVYSSILSTEVYSRKISYGATSLRFWCVSSLIRTIDQEGGQRTRGLSEH